MRPDLARIKRLMWIAAAALVLAAIVGVAVPLAMTATPEFFARYHLLERRYVNLENSAHEGIGCRSCHETQPLVNGVELVADFYTSLVETTATPQFFSFESPHNEACLKCHNNDWTTEAGRIDRIPHPAHKRVADEDRKCTDCHKWTGHFEAYLDKHKEMPMSGVCVAYGCHVGTKTAEQCFDCHHVLHESNEQWRTEHPKVMRASTGQNACLEGCHTAEQCQQCHTTGVRPEFTGLPIEVSMKDIETQHVREDWSQLHGQAALNGRDRCLLCHQDQGECGECHLQRPAFHGPVLSWIGGHSKVTERLDDPACIECHKQSYCDSCHQQFKEME